MRFVGPAIAQTVLAVTLFFTAKTAQTEDPKASTFAVASQYSTTHVYVAPESFDAFVTSVLAVFRGQTSPRSIVTVTPTSSKAISQLVLTPVGTFSVLGFQTPTPYPFGIERTGRLVTDLDGAVGFAAAQGVDVVVAPFDDPIARDAIIASTCPQNAPTHLSKASLAFPAAQSSTTIATRPESRLEETAKRIGVCA
jgi:hypothetical protein